MKCVSIWVKFSRLLTILRSISNFQKAEKRALKAWDSHSGNDQLEVHSQSKRALRGISSIRNPFNSSATIQYGFKTTLYTSCGPGSVSPSAVGGFSCIVVVDCRWKRQGPCIGRPFYFGREGSRGVICSRTGSRRASHQQEPLVRAAGAHSNRGSCPLPRGARPHDQQKNRAKAHAG